MLLNTYKYRTPYPLPREKIHDDVDVKINQNLVNSVNIHPNTLKSGVVIEHLEQELRNMIR